MEVIVRRDPNNEHSWHPYLPPKLLLLFSTCPALVSKYGGSSRGSLPFVVGVCDGYGVGVVFVAEGLNTTASTTSRWIVTSL